MLIGLTDFAKESYLKCVLYQRLSNIKKIKGRQFTSLIDSKLISKLVSSDNSVFLCFHAT